MICLFVLVGEYIYVDIEHIQQSLILPHLVCLKDYQFDYNDAINELQK